MPKKRKRKSPVKTPRLPPLTSKQENSVAIGNLLCWGFMIFMLIWCFALWIIREASAETDSGIFRALLGAPILIYGSYHIIGAILKLDHVRVCAGIWSKIKTDLRNAWSSQDTKSCMFLGVCLAVCGAFFIISGLIKFA